METTVLVVKVVGRVDAVLFSPGHAVLAFVADAGGESNAYQRAQLEVVGGFDVGTKGHDASYAFVATDVWEFDVGDGLAVGAGGCPCFGVEV